LIEGRGKTAKDIAIEMNQTEWLKWCETTTAQIRSTAIQRKDQKFSEDRDAEREMASLNNSFNKTTFAQHFAAGDEQSNPVSLLVSRLTIRNG
jgi:hypothetical protein